MCTASGTGAIIDSAAIACHPDLLEIQNKRQLLLAAGDDYQLLFTIKAEALEAIQQLAIESGIQLSAIGRLTESTEIRLMDGEWPDKVFEHFPKGEQHV